MRFHTPVTSLMTGVIAKEGEEAGVKWTMEQVAGLPPEERAKAVQDLDAWNNLSIEGMTILAGALTPEERVDYASRTMKRSGASPKSYAVLDTLPRPDLLKILREDFERSTDPRSTPPATGYTKKITEEVRTRFQLTAEEVAEVRQLKKR